MSIRRKGVVGLCGCIGLVLVATGIASAGSPIGGDFRISNQTVDAVSPSVAYNSQRQEYLVVWYNDRPGNDDVQAQRVKKTGQKIGGAFFVAAGQGAERRYPDVAYNSGRNEYLVVWEQVEAASGSSIRARRISATGQPLQPPDVVIRGPGSNLYTTLHPAVAYASTSNKYLVVWEEDWHPMPLSQSIEGQVLSSSGTLEGTSFHISQDPGNGAYRREPDLAYNHSRNEYLAVWKQRDPGPGDYDIYARRVQGNGTPLQPESIEIVRAVEDQSAPAVAAVPTTANQGRYLVVWEAHQNPSDIDIHGRRVSGQGNPLDSPYLGYATSTEDETLPAVAGAATTGQFLLTWTRHKTDPQAPWASWDFVYGRVFAQNGVFLGPSVHAAGRYDADHSAVAAGPTGDFLIAFDDDPSASNDRDIHGQLWGNRVYVPLTVRRHR